MPSLTYIHAFEAARTTAGGSHDAMPYKKNVVLVIIAFLLSFTLTASAQAYIPKDGESFIFYPVSSEAQNSIVGFDCFYSTDLAHKNGKFKIKPKFRFKADINELTPFSEIEGHKFTMLSSTIENKDEKKVEKKACILFLQREDGERVFLRIPYVRHNEDNKLTWAMALQFKAGGNKLNYKICVPCCPTKSLEDAKSYFTGEKIMLFSRSRANQEKARELLEKQSEFLGGYIPQDMFSTRGYDLFCDSIGFRDVQSYFFKQPIAYCRYEDRNVLIPVFEYRGVGNSIYGEGFSISNFFERRTDIYNHLVGHNNYHAKTLSLPGKRLRYDGTEYAKLDYEKCKQIKYWQKDQTYFLKKQTAYLCERIDLSNEYAHHFGMCAIMTDSLGNKFQIPLELIDLRDGQNSFTNHKFELEEEYLARTNSWKERKAAEEAALDEAIAKYTSKYKDRSLAIVLAVGKCSEERYLKLRKKYGAKKAGLMARGLYEIGWGYDEVKEAIGDGYFECVHTYENQLGYYERYQHRKYEPTFLVFKNGTLISISD